MPTSKKSTSHAKNPAIENLTGITISVFFLSILIITSVLVIMFVIFGQPDDQKRAWQDLIKEHIERYPAMQPADIYKLVYQGTYGPAHLGADSLNMLNYLQNELAAVDADSNALHYETVCPCQRYIRINLKYFKAVDGDAGKLVSAILKSSQLPCDSALITKRWQWIEEMVADGELPFESAAFQAFSDTLKIYNYPVIHHSGQYLKAYQPAYRLIKKDFLNSLSDVPAVQ